MGEGSQGRDGEGGHAGGGDRAGADARRDAPASMAADSSTWGAEPSDLPVMALGIPAPISEDEARLLAFVAQTTGQKLPPERPAKLPLVVGPSAGQVAARITIRDALAGDPVPVAAAPTVANAAVPKLHAAPTSAKRAASAPAQRAPAKPTAPASNSAAPASNSSSPAATVARSSARAGALAQGRERPGSSPLIFGVAAAGAAGFMLSLMLVAPGVERTPSAADHSLAPAIDPSAAQRLERAVSISPGDAALRLELGDAYRRLGRIDDARSQFREASSLGDARGEARLRALADGGAADGSAGHTD